MRQSGVVIELNEAQIWTVIGVLAATLISTVGVMAHFGTRLLQESIGRVLERIDARFEALDYRFETIDARFGGLEARLTERIDGLDARISARIDALDARIHVLDRDVQAIANRAFGGASTAES